MDGDDGSPEPLVRVVRGAPDDFELAAVLAVLAAIVRPATEPASAPPRSAWGDPATRFRRPSPNRL